MSPELPPIKTWQFYHAAAKVLSISALQKIYKRSQRQVYRWAADPDCTSDHERNPLDRLIVIFHRLDELGRRDLALAAVRLMAGAVDHEVRPIDPVQPDQDSLEAEALDDLPMLVRFHNACRSGDDEGLVQHFLDEAVAELKQTFESFKQHKTGDDP